MDTHSGSRGSVSLTMERDPGLSSVCCDSREFDEWETDTRQQMRARNIDRGGEAMLLLLPGPLELLIREVKST